jgi:hypothetical protein
MPKSIFIEKIYEIDENAIFFLSSSILSHSSFLLSMNLLESSRSRNALLFILILLIKLSALNEFQISEWKNYDYEENPNEVGQECLKIKST